MFTTSRSPGWCLKNRMSTATTTATSTSRNGTKIAGLPTGLFLLRATTWDKGDRPEGGADASPRTAPLSPRSRYSPRPAPAPTSLVSRPGPPEFDDAAPVVR